MDDWLSIEATFKKWNFPHVLGAVDGKHIAIKKPAKSGSVYFNYKKFFSLILLVAADGDGRIISYDLGRPGSHGYSGVYNSCCIKDIIQSDIVPDPEPFAPGLPPTPYFYVGDAAFALDDTMMKGYAHDTDVISERVFNYRLSRARRIVENCFGMLSNRFRLLLSQV